MRRPIGADKSGPIHHETYRQLLNGDVVHDLIVGSLQEGRIDRAERLVTLRRQTGRECHRMLLGDSDVESAIRECLAKNVTPVPPGIAAVMATMRSSFSASLTRLSPKTFV